ncbi:hypothetical protein [Dictyobacter kobayashii]|uniref:Uncharacterized protein n=1 Tax=Dictyobacter kobayashii TaxID=2014872 RepID=A0A402AUH8_9CHLR|nr:hypothetical protein [Dictyobacter kobayashii]GCE22747.1 hypothetical protein KDK_65470 [Dictyobacter kobayashii]
MKLLNIFRNNQSANLIAQAPETELDELELAKVNGGHGGDCYRNDDCDRHDDCDDRHYENDCYRESHRHYRRHRSHCE